MQPLNELIRDRKQAAGATQETSTCPSVPTSRKYMYKNQKALFGTNKCLSRNLTPMELNVCLVKEIWTKQFSFCCKNEASDGGEKGVAFQHPKKVKNLVACTRSYFWFEHWSNLNYQKANASVTFARRTSGFWATSIRNKGSDMGSINVARQNRTVWASKLTSGSFLWLFWGFFKRLSGRWWAQNGVSNALFNVPCWDFLQGCAQPLFSLVREMEQVHGRKFAASWTTIFQTRLVKGSAIHLQLDWCSEVL